MSAKPFLFSVAYHKPYTPLGIYWFVPYYLHKMQFKLWASIFIVIPWKSIFFKYIPEELSHLITNYPGWHSGMVLNTIETFVDTNVERKRCTYDVNLMCSKALIGQAPVSDVKVTSYVHHLRSSFLSRNVHNNSTAWSTNLLSIPLIHDRKV